MRRLLEEVSRDHFPYPPATPEQIEAFEDDDHEAWPDPAYCKQVASSSSEFLEQVLRTLCSLYWIPR